LPNTGPFLHILHIADIFVLLHFVNLDKITPLKIQRKSFFMRHPIRTIFLTVFLIVVVIVSLLFADFLSGGSLNESGAAVKKSDAIVVLTGGRGRITEGISLLREGAAKVLILSGVNTKADLKGIFPEGLKKKVTKRIILEKKSKDTYENAVEVKKIMKKRGYKSIILITSNYHMRRALFVMREVLSKDIVIHPIGVSTLNYDNNRLWAEKNLLLNLSEFFKFTWFRVHFTASYLMQSLMTRL